MIKSDLVSKIEMATKPYAMLVLAAILWSLDMVKRNIIGYGELVNVERRLAAFSVTYLSEPEKEFLMELTSLTPSNFGLDLSTVSRRCLIDSSKILDLVRVLNIVKDVTSLVLSAKVLSDFRRTKINCLTNEDMLPALYVNPQAYLRLAIDSLKNEDAIARDPFIMQVLEIMNNKLKQQPTYSDYVAMALVMLALAQQYRSHNLCIEPGIALEVFVKKMYNELASAETNVEESEIYHIYQELISKSVIKKGQTK